MGFTDEEKAFIKSNKRLQSLHEFFNGQIEKFNNSDRYINNPVLLKRTIDRLEADKAKSVKDYMDAEMQSKKRLNTWLENNYL